MVADVTTEIPELNFRKKQEDTLAAVLRPLSSNSYGPSCVLLHGPRAVGKTTAWRRVVKERQVRHVELDCGEIYSARLLYELTAAAFSRLARVQPDAAVASGADLVRFLQEVVIHNRPAVLVLERAEQLLHLPDTVLSLFTDLQSAAEVPITTMLVSHVPLEGFLSQNVHCHLYPIYFPAFTQEELTALVCQRCRPPDVIPVRFNTFAALVVASSIGRTNDVRELCRMAVQLYPSYSVAAAEATCQASLLRSLTPALNKALAGCYTAEGAAAAQARLAVELAYYPKMLLLSAYLASFNPPAADKRLLCKSTGAKVSKRAELSRRAGAARDSGHHKRGARPFALQRLLAIFSRVADSRVGGVQLLTQLNELCRLGLLTRSTIPEGPRSQAGETPRFTCVVPLDTARSLAATLNFDLDSKLFDFLHLQ